MINATNCISGLSKPMWNTKHYNGELSKPVSDTLELQSIEDTCNEGLLKPLEDVKTDGEQYDVNDSELYFPNLPNQPWDEKPNIIAFT